MDRDGAFNCRRACDHLAFADRPAWPVARATPQYPAEHPPATIRQPTSSYNIIGETLMNNGIATCLTRGEFLRAATVGASGLGLAALAGDGVTAEAAPPET